MALVEPALISPPTRAAVLNNEALIETVSNDFLTDLGFQLGTFTSFVFTTVIWKSREIDLLKCF